MVSLINNIAIVKKEIKNINIRVKPNCDVILTAPLKTTDEHILYVINKRANWINEKIEFYKSNQTVLLKEYVSGENFKYLGRNYRLKVIESNEEIVKLQRGYLYLFIKDKTNLNKKKILLDNWYKAKAKIHFDKALAKYQQIVKKDIKSVKIREMKTRWGSCNPAKSYINLNSELIKKSTSCIEYVVFHELTHLIHTDHNKQFYNYLSVYMPDWKKRKRLLEKTN
jgi:predicted metal-dependent hydrolase